MPSESDHDVQRSVDRLYLLAAIRLAERGLTSVTRNNPRVGCLIVNDGSVVGRGWHRRDGGAHAEIEALRAAEYAGNSVQGGTAYVSLEPCCWTGRTPPCTEALKQAGVSRVVVAATDPHPNVSGQGLSQLTDAGLDVTLIELTEAKHLNPGQYTRQRFHRPWIRIKIALSTDGRIAMASGESQWITGQSAREDAQYWRARSGAIVTGIGTVLADDPRLTVRDPRYSDSKPWRLVFDTHCRTPSDCKLFDDSSRVIVACSADADTADCEADIWRQSGKTVNPTDILKQLSDEGVNELLVEAGPHLVGSFVRDDLWDEFLVYMAPKFLGHDALPAVRLDLEKMADTVNGQIQSITQVGRDLRVIISRHVQHFA